MDDDKKLIMEMLETADSRKIKLIICYIKALLGLG